MLNTWSDPKNLRWYEFRPAFLAFTCLCVIGLQLTVGWSHSDFWWTLGTERGWTPR